MPLQKSFNTLMAFQFIRELTKDWTEMPAYKLGIIDDNGKILKPLKELKTADEKDAYTFFHRMIWNIKRTLEALPGGKSKLKSYAAAAWLLKENKEYIVAGLRIESFGNDKKQADLLLEEITTPTNTVAGVPTKEEPLKKKKKKMPLLSLVKKINDIKEGKVIKKVVRQGKIIKKAKCGPGMQVKDGRCVPLTSVDKQRFVKSARKRKRTMAGKSLAKANLKRAKSDRKRNAAGLV